jgi:hypothetical protein
MRNTWNFGKPITPSASYDFSLFLYIFFEFFRGGRNFAFPRPDTSVRRSIPEHPPGMSGHQARMTEHQDVCGRAPTQACPGTMGGWPSTNPGMAGHQPRMSEHQEAYARAPTQSCPGIMGGWPSIKKRTPEHPTMDGRASTLDDRASRSVCPNMSEHQPRQVRACPSTHPGMSGHVRAQPRHVRYFWRNTRNF